MKTKNIFKFVAIFFIAASLSSCVEDGDYSTPTLGPDQEYLNLMSLSEIKDLYNTNGGLINFDDYIQAASINEITTYGYVISNDRAGNFFKTIIIQDKIENPTIGVEVRIDDTNLNARYNVGRKVYIKLSNNDTSGNIFERGLAFTKRFETYQIGVSNSSGTGVDRIGIEDYIDYIDRSSEVARIVPTVLKIDELTDSHIYTLIKLEDMQALNEGETFANPDNTFSVNRFLKNCETEENITMRTSGFATFKSLEIPRKRGSVTAILNKFSTTYQLNIRDIHDFDFTQERCEPLFEENFDNFDKWTIQNIIGNGQEWEITTFGNPGPSAKMSGFQNGPQDNEDWLISKAIDLSNVSGALNLRFDSVKRFGGNDIEVFYSTNYNGGNPNDTGNSWTQLSPTLDTNTNSWTSWTSSGSLDVSAAAGGNLYVAFKYTSSTSSGAATFEIDNVKVSLQ